MGKLPQVSGKDIGRVLVRLHFELKSQRGSHMKFVRKHQYGREVVIVPNHKTIRAGTLHDILKQLNLTAEKLMELL